MRDPLESTLQEILEEVRKTNGLLEKLLEDLDEFYEAATGTAGAGSFGFGAAIMELLENVKELTFAIRELSEKLGRNY